VRAEGFQLFAIGRAKEPPMKTLLAAAVAYFLILDIIVQVALGLT
jgi:hypothetical protein